MQVKVLFFGKLAEAANQRFGAHQVDKDHLIECPDSCSTVAELKQFLLQKQDALSLELNKANTVFAVNHQICQEDQAIQMHDEVAFMSPLSGG
jgi:molybdopterin converting factor small subunit